MKKDIYFVSDCHFKPQPDHNQSRERQMFFDFLEKIESSAARLYLVGDVFDFWFEYKYVIPKYLFDVLFALKKIAINGCEIHILGGNHDYWMGDFFTNNGISVHQEDIELDYQNKKFFITHGDGKLNLDPLYPLLKSFLRNKFIIKLFKIVHPDLAFRIADFVSRSSRNQDPDTNDELMQFYDEKIEKFCREKFKEDYDFIVTGHYHYPKTYDYQGYRFINLGDWVRHFTYGYFSEGKLLLSNYLDE